MVHFHVRVQLSSKGKEEIVFSINPSNNIMRKEAEVFLNYC